MAFASGCSLLASTDAAIARSFLDHSALSVDEYGRGYTWAFDSIKPDIIAPGVDIISCSNTGGYTSKTGTSMAAPFVTGAAALLMEWGIARGNDLYMYGDKLKASLIKGAGENVFTTASRAVSENTSKNTKYPNPVTGWGTLCLLDSIP